MKRTPVFAIFLLLTAGLASGPARADALHVIRSSPRYPGDALTVARAYLQDQATPLDIHDVDLVHRGTLALGDLRTVRLMQSYAGLPVLGAAAVVRTTPDGRVTAVGLRVARTLRVATTPRLVETDVRTVLMAHVGPAAAAGRIALVLAVLPEPDGPGRLVWQADVPLRGGLRYLIDAQVGDVLSVRPLAVNARGRVYPISSANTPAVQDLELADLDDATPLRLTGWNGQLVVGNYVSGGSQTEIVAEQTLGPSEGPDFLYDPPADALDPDDGFAQVGLYYHLSRSRGFYAGTLGLDFSPASWKLMAVANYRESGQNEDNAFFTEMGMGPPWNTPNLIAVGQGTQFDLADDSDVFLHEFLHYVSHNAVGFNMGQMGTTPLGLSPFSGSIDEGLADYFACTQNGDPILGEASLALLGAARDLTDTSKVCPDDVYGEVHMDGEIIGSLTWTLRESLDASAADQLVWGAMTLLLPYATFGDLSEALLSTAGDLQSAGTLTPADVQTVQSALDARGLTDCYQELPLAEGTPRTLMMFGLDLIGQMMGGTCQQVRAYDVSLASLFHVRAQPTASADGIRFRVTLTPQGGNDLQWAIHGRQGQSVGFRDSGFMPEVRDFDYVVDGLTGTEGELVIDASSIPAFDPTQTYHAVIVHQNCPSTRAVVSVESFTNPVVTPDAGVDASLPDAAPSADASTTPPDDPKSGCGCQASGDAAPLLPGLLLGLLGLVWRLRRRRG
jgi:MYXO-CTERM domain-containing protein